jgi:hypothetical protein
VQPVVPGVQRNDRAVPTQREVKEPPKEQPVRTAQPVPEAHHEASPQPRDEKKPVNKREKKNDKKNEEKKQ